VSHRITLTIFLVHIQGKLQDHHAGQILTQENLAHFNSQNSHSIQGGQQVAEHNRRTPQYGNSPLVAKVQLPEHDSPKSTSYHQVQSHETPSSVDTLTRAHTQSLSSSTSNVNDARSSISSTGSSRTYDSDYLKSMHSQGMFLSIIIS
jgi:predicted membrane-bound mannosyltransferase